MRYLDPNPSKRDGYRATTNHTTPRMHQLPNDPAHFLLDNAPVTPQKVHRKGCYICEDREFARMGLPLCNRCCMCSLPGWGHIPADDEQCDDCGHKLCRSCLDLPAQDEPICTCDTPCCEADVGVGIITCESQHCPTHGEKPDDRTTDQRTDPDL